MSMSSIRIRALYRKELREYRHSGYILATMAVLPLGVLVFPTILVIALPASAASAFQTGDPLIILLGIPALLPSILAGYAVVGEREQGTLEPMLTTPISREELVLAKALAAFVPSLVIAYVMYAAFLLVTRLFAQPTVAAAVIQTPDVLVQVLFTPLIALLTVWISLAMSTRANDVRVAMQLGAIAGLPVLLVAYLTTFGVIPATLAMAIGIGAGLLVLDGIGWRLVSALFNRERLIASTR